MAYSKWPDFDQGAVMLTFKWIAPTALMLLVSAVFGQSPKFKDTPPKDLASTFSLVARDLETGELGIVVASKYLAVGSAVPFANAKIGAIATQSYVNVDYGPDGLALLSQGKNPKETLDLLLSRDSGKDYRQVGLLNLMGKPEAFTGSKCMPWAGHKLGTNYTAQGNLLAGPKVIDDMAKAFEEAKGPLASRLFKALKAGDEAGGDKRGRQSAAILIVKPKGGPNGFGDRWIDLRVDDHPAPVKELGRLLELSGKAPNP